MELTRAFLCLKKEKMNIENQDKSKNNKPVHKPGVLVMGADLNFFSNESLGSYAHQVSEHLNSPWTNPKTPKEIEIAIREARAVICLSEDYSQVLAFAKLEFYGVNDAKQVLYEFGSWIGGNGCGKEVYEGGRDLATEKYPYACLIAFVRSGNIKAQRIITETGGVKVGYTHEGKHVYDITRRQQPTETIRMSSGGVWIKERNNNYII